MSAEPRVYDRSIAVLLEGSVELAMNAERSGSPRYGGVLARASVITTTFFLEASANACLDTLRLPDDFEKLTVLSKFDAFARMSKAKFIDHSIDETQGMVDILKLRNLYAHPKAQPVNWREVTDISSVAVSPRTKHLGLPIIASYFEPEHAVIALRAAHRFLRYLFIDLCRMTPDDASAMLFSYEKIPASQQHGAPLTYSQMQKWLRYHKICVDYLQWQAIG